MFLTITRSRKDKPLLSSIKLGEYEFEGLTTNNIIICESNEIANTITKRLMSIQNYGDKDFGSEFEVNIGLWDFELLELSEEEFVNLLHKPSATHVHDKLHVQRELDEVEIMFEDYALQKFFISPTPELIYRAESVNDIYFVGNEVFALTEFKNCEKLFEDRGKLVELVRDGRFIY